MFLGVELKTLLSDPGNAAYFGVNAMGVAAGAAIHNLDLSADLMAKIPWIGMDEPTSIIGVGIEDGSASLIGGIVVKFENAQGQSVYGQRITLAGFGAIDVSVNPVIDIDVELPIVANIADIR